MPLGSQWCRSAASASMGRLYIVDHAFLLLWVMSVDSIRVCHALRRSSEMVLDHQFLPECDDDICDSPE